MQPDRWRRIEEIYHQALEQEPAMRTAFLAETCRSDLDLRREVEELLAQQGSVLDRPAWELPDLKPGGRLSYYEIVSKLGEGGMGLVYRARDTKLDRAVAIKVLPSQLAQDPGRLARFDREAKALAALNHPNIAQIYSIEDRAIVMELVDGETLKGPLPLETALDYARQIAGALSAAHDKGIIHRDLKPENIKVTPQGVVKVLDFGLAAIRLESDPADSPDPDLSKSPTAAGMILGTAAYMSPEQARGLPVDKRADVWAFGCVVYEMLTGERAFPGRTTSDSLAAVLAGEPRLDVIPAKARRLVQTCLAKDVQQRLQAIGDWRLLIEDVAPPRNTAGNRLAWAAAALLALALIAVVGFVRFRREPAPAGQVRFQVLAPDQTTFGNAFALSPDGRQLAFAAVGSKGESMLWIRPLDALDARPLHGTEGAAYLPFWSPDSRSLAFGAGGQLKRIDIAGGPPQVLCDAPPIVTGGSWSPNGTILFASNSGHPIWRVPASGGAVVPVTKLAQGDAYHLGAQFLPDGRHFIYVRLSQTAARGVYVGSIDAKPEEQESRLVVNADFPRYAEAPLGGGGYLLFLREQTLMAQRFDVVTRSLQGDPVAIADPVGLFATRGLFSVSASGVLAYRQGASEVNRLTWFDLTGKPVGNASDLGRFENVALSPDGSQLAAQRPNARGYDIWLTDLVRATSTRFTFGPGLQVDPVWSRDGERIAYALERNNGADVFKKNSNGAGAEEALFHYNDNAFPQDWSRDGRSLLVAVRGARTGDDLWVIPLTGTHQPAPFLQTPFNESQAQLSPDGRWVAYMSDLSGQPEIYVRPFPSVGSNGGQWMISSGGGFQPRWRGDSKELFYLSGDPGAGSRVTAVGGGRVMAVDISTTPNFKASLPRVLFEVPIYVSTAPTASLHTWDVSADGKRFLINVDMSANRAQPITVVLNWTAALKK